MNYDQIKNSEERIFPFYKGKYMGKTELGFSNRKSAQKFMNDIPQEDIYAKFGGKEEYKRTHSYICRPYAYELDRLYLFNPPKSERYGYSYYSARRFKEIPDANQNDIVYTKNIPENTLKEYKEIINSLGFIPDAINDSEKIEKIKKFIKDNNLFPAIYVDLNDYNKMHAKMMKEEIEYKRGIVHINIEYLD